MRAGLALAALVVCFVVGVGAVVYYWHTEDDLGRAIGAATVAFGLAAIIIMAGDR